MNTVIEKPRLSRLYRLQWEEAQGAYVLLYPEGMVQLNDSAAQVLKRCDGRRNTAEIVQDLERAFSTSGLRHDVEDFLHAASERGWVV
ncbi:pyrroloquinoline quinone biosynthesis peptide chaperone PqqD [Noviherbaspirillum saxi]|uniref:Pyrroloquinoline quinone biosynthesis peptide chaperone PqqD n=1 Tax=Noviherbaspirillum saxi TaxID=2320863 RepID=A0A3A3FH16_9BURK|nr:pyrroloquinoline quinone biosynthesis peptide chaperone PqqD [Noviherbaspirillum saxi]RJF92437.1 pyrroloquinoline quinone biosynthesis peptide chaperone PqqD [Noviherbaspirillum saxi]